MRLNRYLAHAGLGSRRAVESLITQGRVTVDGRAVTDLACRVGPDATVAVDGRVVLPEGVEYHLLHKPLGVISTASDPHGRAKVTDFIRSRVRLYPVGRLDADSTGAILLTNDGDAAMRMTHPRYGVEKTYRAEVEGIPGSRLIRLLISGIELEDGTAIADRARVVRQRRSSRPAVLEIVIHQGRNRQVRRMLDAAGHPAVSLARIAFGPIRLGSLAPGRSRELTPGEVAEIRRYHEIS